MFLSLFPIVLLLSRLFNAHIFLIILTFLYQHKSCVFSPFHIIPLYVFLNNIFIDFEILLHVGKISYIMMTGGHALIMSCQEILTEYGRGQDHTGCPQDSPGNLKDHFVTNDFIVNMETYHFEANTCFLLFSEHLFFVFIFVLYFFYFICH